MTEVSLSRAALSSNLALVRGRVAPAELMAVVKDDAYGHGLSEIVPMLLREGVRRFGVLDLRSGARVRAMDEDAEIFAWVVDDHDDLRSAIAERIEFGVSDSRLLERLAAAGDTEAGQLPRIHIKIDSGLHRAGVLPGGWAAFVAQVAELQASGSVHLAGVWTHIAEASDEADSAAIALFDDAVTTVTDAGLKPQLRHLAASAASFFRSDARYDLVRVGAFLYGIAPGSGMSAADLGLRPVMTVRAEVVSVDPSEGIALIDVGGVDGLLADAADAVSVTIDGRRHALVSVRPFTSAVRVDADSVRSGAVRPGATVTLFGPGASGEQTITDWADAMGTIGEELATRLGSRGRRSWSD